MADEKLCSEEVAQVAEEPEETKFYDFSNGLKFASESDAE
jgi:hypothetical protein